MPAIIENNFQAFRVFTDRLETQEAFKKEYQYIKEHRGEYALLSYYGIGGIGKTALLNQLEKTCYPFGKEEEWIGKYHISYDFDTSTDLRTILSSWRNLLISLDNKLFSFLNFDIACLIYAEKTGDADSMIAESKSILEKNPVLSAALEAGALIPGVSVATQVIKAINESNNARIDLKEKQAANRVRLALEGLGKAEILSKLPEFFYMDLGQCMKEAKEPLVIFLDTYEKLTNGMEPVKLKKDDWLFGTTHGIMCKVPNVLWVIFGRDKLSYPWRDMGFKTLPIGTSLADVEDPDSYVESKLHLLGNLAEKDARSFLTGAAVPANYHEEIISFTQGNPLWLDVAVDAYEDSFNAGREFDVHGISSAEDLVKRYLKYMDDGMQDIVKKLSVIGEWTQESLDAILGEINETTYKKVEKSCFIQKLDNKVKMHNLMRMTIYKICMEDNYRSIDTIYDKACDYYKGCLRDNKAGSMAYEEALLSLVELYSFVEEAEFNTTEIIGYVDDMLHYGSYDTAIRVLGMMKDKCDAVYGEYSVESLKCAEKMADVYCDQKKYESAQTALLIILAGCKHKYGEEAEIYLRLYEKTAYISFLDHQYHDAVGRWSEMLGKLKDTDYMMQSANLNAIALAMAEMGNLSEAISTGLRSVELLKKSGGGMDSNYVLALLNLGSIFFKNSQTADEESITREAEAVWDKIEKPEVSEQIKILAHFCDRYSECHQDEKALEMINRAYELALDNYGEASVEALFCMDEKLLRLRDLGFYDDALENSDRAIEITKQIWGEEHPFTQKRILFKTIVLSSMGRGSDSRQLLEKICQLRKDIYGPDHAETLQAMTLLAMEYEKAENYDKAYKLAKEVYVISRQKDMCSVDTSRYLGYLCRLSGYIQDYREYFGILEQVEQDTKELAEKYGPSNKRTMQKYTDYLKAQSYLLYFNDLPDQDFMQLIDKLDRHATQMYQNKNLSVAIEIEERVVDVCRKAFSDTGELTLRFMDHLATFLAAAKEYDRAIELTTKNYEIHKAASGEEDDQSLNLQYFLLTLYVYKEDYENGAQVGEKVAELYEKKLGEEHQYTIDALKMLVTCYEGLKDYDSLLKVRNKLYGIYGNIKGPESFEAMDQLLGVAFARYGKKDYRMAKVLAWKVFEYFQNEYYTAQYTGDRSTMSQIAQQAHVVKAFIEKIEDEMKAEGGSQE